MDYKTLNLLIEEILKEPQYYVGDEVNQNYPSLLDALQDSLQHDEDNQIDWNQDRAKLLSDITEIILASEMDKSKKKPIKTKNRKPMNKEIPRVEEKYDNIQSAMEQWLYWEWTAPCHHQHAIDEVVRKGTEDVAAFIEFRDAVMDGDIFNHNRALAITRDRMQMMEHWFNEEDDEVLSWWRKKYPKFADLLDVAHYG